MRIKQWTKETVLAPFLLCRGAVDSRSAMLTFDDGPHAAYTPEVLDVLKQHGAKATFFVVGEKVTRHPQLVERIADEGHELGNHSMTHGDFSRLSYADIVDEVARLDEMLRRARLGEAYRGRFRPPQGAINLQLLAYCASHRRRLVLWNRDPRDFAAGTVKEITDNFDREPIKAGDIVLLHDCTAHIGQAVDHILCQMSTRQIMPKTVSS